MSGEPPRVPRLTQITDLARVSREELEGRLRRSRAPLLVLVRDKELPREARRAWALWVRDLARPLGHRVILAADVELALELGLDGAHLPERDLERLAEARAALGPERLLTVACHDVGAVVRACERGASAALLSPVLDSPGKGPALGLERLREARAALARQARPCQLVALGGIDASSAAACLAAGADGVAVIRADLTGLEL